MRQELQGERGEYLDHSIQIQQASKTHVLQFSSNFNHLLEYIREAIQEYFRPVSLLILIL